MKRIVVFGLVAAILVISAATVFAAFRVPNRDYQSISLLTGRLTVSVRENGVPVAAHVWAVRYVNGNRLQSYSFAANGWTSFEDLPQATYSVMARKANVPAFAPFASQDNVIVDQYEHVELSLLMRD